MPGGELSVAASDEMTTCRGLPTAISLLMAAVTGAPPEKVRSFSHRLS